MLLLQLTQITVFLLLKYVAGYLSGTEEGTCKDPIVFEMILYCTSTNSLIWREFCWKNLTRYFIKPKINSRQLAIQQVLYVEADRAHIFLNCIKIRIYWQNENSVVKNVLGYEIPNTSSLMYLGNIEVVMKEDMYYYCGITRSKQESGHKKLAQCELEADICTAIPRVTEFPRDGSQLYC